VGGSTASRAASLFRPDCASLRAATAVPPRLRVPASCHGRFRRAATVGFGSVRRCAARRGGGVRGDWLPCEARRKVTRWSFPTHPSAPVAWHDAIRRQRHWSVAKRQRRARGGQSAHSVRRPARYAGSSAPRTAQCRIARDTLHTTPWYTPRAHGSTVPPRISRRDAPECLCL
jgi:hypothetical protein